MGVLFAEDVKLGLYFFNWLYLKHVVGNEKIFSHIVVRTLFRKGERLLQIYLR